MRRRIEKPRILLLDCTLEYKKGESQVTLGPLPRAFPHPHPPLPAPLFSTPTPRRLPQTNIELTDDKAWEELLRQEEDHIQAVCDEIIAVKPDLVITEKGVSDLAQVRAAPLLAPRPSPSTLDPLPPFLTPRRRRRLSRSPRPLRPLFPQHYLGKANISVIRRIRKTDNNRIARATGATIVHRTAEASEKDIGTGAGLFEVSKIGDEYFSWIVGETGRRLLHHRLLHSTSTPLHLHLHHLLTSTATLPCRLRRAEGVLDRAARRVEGRAQRGRAQPRRRDERRPHDLPRPAPRAGRRRVGDDAGPRADRGVSYSPRPPPRHTPSHPASLRRSRHRATRRNARLR